MREVYQAQHNVSLITTYIGKHGTGLEEFRVDSVKERDQHLVRRLSSMVIPLKEISERAMLMGAG